MSALRNEAAPTNFLEGSNVALVSRSLDTTDCPMRQRRRIVRKCASPAWVLALVVVAGCGPSEPARISVGGQVSYRGKPVDDGIVSFLPMVGTFGPTVSAPIREGGYRLTQEEGLYVGDYRVEIEAFRKTGRKVRDLVGPDRRLSEPPMIEERQMFLPPKFNLDSTLAISVTPESTIFDFPLED